jgi:hypothetical protein
MNRELGLKKSLLQLVCVDDAVEVKDRLQSLLGFLLEEFDYWLEYGVLFSKGQKLKSRNLPEKRPFVSGV